VVKVEIIFLVLVVAFVPRWFNLANTSLLNCVYSFSNLGNGMCPMAFFGKIDIYAVKNRYIRYLWMLKIHF